MKNKKTNLTMIINVKVSTVQTAYPEIEVSAKGKTSMDTFIKIPAV